MTARYDMDALTIRKQVPTVGNRQDHLLVLWRKEHLCEGHEY